jgi:hypothetical protein
MRLTLPPLWIFLGAGALLFGLQAWRGDEGESETLVLDAALLEGLQERARQRFGASATLPSDRELLETWVNDEILYREALAMGLDRDDEIIRGRLLHKMQLVLEDLEGLREPTEAELQALLDEGPQRFQRAGSRDIEHVFLRDREGEDRLLEASDLLRALRQGSEPAGMGDRFVRGPVLTRMTPEEFVRDFGGRFARAINDAPVGEWTGPHHSPHGLHLVRVTAQHEARMATVDEVRRRLVEVFRERERASMRARFLEDLRARWTVIDRTGVAP